MNTVHPCAVLELINISLHLTWTHFSFISISPKGCHWYTYLFSTKKCGHEHLITLYYLIKCYNIDTDLLHKD
jgi:hypothetical protein